MAVCRYDFDKEICLKHFQNGTTPHGGGCSYVSAAQPLVRARL